MSTNLDVDKSSENIDNEPVSFHQISRLLRLVENRRCGDCSSPLGDGKSTYAQTDFGIWICKKCAEVHNRFVSSNGLLLALSKSWTNNALNNMILSGSNIKRNKFLERYNNGLFKATSDSSSDERELWIRCKYKYLLAIPAISEEEQRKAMRNISNENGNNNNDDNDNDYDNDHDSTGRPSMGASVSMKGLSIKGSHHDSNKKVLPMRLVDFFVTLGPASYTIPRIVNIKPTKINKDGSFILEKSSPTLTGNADVDEKPILQKPILPSLPSLPDKMLLPASVLDCFPDAKTYDDSSLPDVAAPFVFPSGLYLSSEEKPPAIFTFVLTDENRVKIYAAALLFYEVLEPKDIIKLVTPKNGVMNVDTTDGPNLSYEEAYSQRKTEIASLPGWSLVYAPRALTVMGHYPFFTAYTEFLKDMYHTSLSAAPVPIERFINNFVVETPLPPLGRIEVNIVLPTRMLSLTRPPINRLPMVDFSYRPLFACLSINNIITTFRMMCGEYSICFVSKNLSLLTPVQEAMLSFLFPLQWQGVYIPILPKLMMEILDAPVPIVTGILDSYIKMIPLKKRPTGVLYVNLDNDTLYLGGTKMSTHPYPELSLTYDSTGYDEARNEIINFLQEPMPKMFIKLKMKLNEYGSCIYHSKKAITLLETCNLAYPNNEYLTPISVFAMEAGSASKDNNQGNERCAATLSYINGNGNGNSNGNDVEETILSPNNNCTKWDENDMFDASELRNAFLRFFVAVFIETDSKHEIIQKVLDEGSTNRFSVASLRMSTIPSERTSIKGGPEPFFLVLLATQMYSEFKDERQFNSDLPEIRYFDESIAAKKNRSRFTFSTQSTPFLDSRSNDIQEIYTPPTPTVAGLPLGQLFEYDGWPLLKINNVGPPRSLRLLLKGGAEKARKANKLHNASRYNILTEGLFVNHNMNINNNNNNNNKRNISSSDTGVGVDANTNTNTSSNEESQTSGRLEDVLSAGEKRYFDTCKSIAKLQALFRMSKKRKLWILTRKAAIIIQSALRSYKCSKLVGGMRVLFYLKEQILHVIKIQSSIRSWSTKIKYKKIIRMTLWCQSIVRSGDIHAMYIITRNRFRLLTAICRGFLARRIDENRREDLFKQYRHQLLLLWKLECTTLHYRSLFWVMIRLPSYLHLAMLRDELFRLYKSLGILEKLKQTKDNRLPITGTGTGKGTIKSHRYSGRVMRRGTTIDGLVGRANESRHTTDVVHAVNSIHIIDEVEHSQTWKLIVANQGISNGNDALSLHLGEKFSKSALMNSSRDKEQREVLYKTMKQNINIDDLNEYYLQFGLHTDAKKKKDTVVYHLLFNENNNTITSTNNGGGSSSSNNIDPMQIIDTSAALIMHVYHGKDGHSDALLVSKKSGWFNSSSNTTAQDTTESSSEMCSPTNDRYFGIEEKEKEKEKRSNWIDEWFERKKAERIRSASLETLQACLAIIATQKIHIQKTKNVR